MNRAGMFRFVVLIALSCHISGKRFTKARDSRHGTTSAELSSDGFQPLRHRDTEKRLCPL